MTKNTKRPSLFNITQKVSIFFSNLEYRLTQVGLVTILPTKTETAVAKMLFGFDNCDCVTIWWQYDRQTWLHVDSVVMEKPSPFTV